MKTANCKKIVAHHAYNWMIDSLASFHVLKRSKKPLLVVVTGTWSSSLGMSLLLILATFVRIARASSLRPFTRSQRTDSGINLRVMDRLVFADITFKESRAVNKSTSSQDSLSSPSIKRAKERKPGIKAFSKCKEWRTNEHFISDFFYFFTDYPRGSLDRMEK